MRTVLSIGTFLLCLLLTHGVATGQELGKRNLASLDGFAWKSSWSTAEGRIRRSRETESGSGEGLRFTVDFLGKGFTYYAASPFPNDQSFPGVVRKLRIVAKMGDGPNVWYLKFNVKDGQAGKEYRWPIKKFTNQWAEYVFTVPADHPPITGLVVGAHNWDYKQTKMSSDLYVSELEVFTDLSGVTDTSSLLSVSATTGRERNLFADGEDLALTVTAGSWFAETLNGNLDVTVIDPWGKTVFNEATKMTLDDGLSKRISHTPESFGVYTIRTKLSFDNGMVFEKESQCASIPTAPTYTHDEQRIAPWAINIHGGIEGVAYASIKQLGFQWIRDYAYQDEWLIKGRANGDWTGWPWFLKMDRKISEAGLMLLPSVMKSIGNHIEKSPVPPQGWLDESVQLMLKFPHYQAFEPDNEVDLHYPKVLKEDNYLSYGLYHAAYAKAVKGVRPHAWVVEQGQAGIKTEILEACIPRGHFDDVDVVNAHFYCGTSPALLTRHNANTGQSGALAGNLFDKMRAFVKAAGMDGKDRQAWMTEFGWDTLVMHVVSEQTQAAYTQRGYAMGLHAGFDKLFLYWNRDTKKPVPDTFFDGMGIFDPQDEPKPVAAAMAAMIHLLKLPKVVGTFSAGENGYGYIFRDRGRLVGMAFQLDSNKPAPTVTFKTGKLLDMYANPLEGREHTLDIGTIWIDNIAPTDPFVRQTDFKMTSNRYVRGAAGDTMVLSYELTNPRNQAYTATITHTLPAGWRVASKPEPLTVNPGETRSISVSVNVDRRAQQSDQRIWTTISDGQVSKRIFTDVEVVRPAALGTLTLAGKPGTTTLPFSIMNHSLQPRSFTVKPKLPAGWHATPAQLVFKDMEGVSSANGSFQVTWTDDYDANVPAQLEVADETGVTVYHRPIVPSAFALPRAGSLTMDGSFTDWPAGSALPKWIVGTIGNPDDLTLRAAYAPEGLYLGVEVAPSDAKASTPKLFWSCDALEICLDTKNDKTPRGTYQTTDHQFWVTPMVDKNSVYLGRWKRNQEIKSTRYDIPTKGFSRKTKTGYAMELLIPAAEINGYSPASGTELGMSVVLSIPSKTGTSAEAYWPLPKGDKVIFKPHLWGNVELD